MKCKHQLKPYAGSQYRHGWFYDELYQANFRVVSPKKGETLTSEKLAVYLNDQFKVNYQKDGESWNASTINLETSSGVPITVFAFREEVPSICDIAHEAVHGANGLLRHTGMKPDAENDESYAYLVGSLARRIALCLGRK